MKKLYIAILVLFSLVTSAQQNYTLYLQSGTTTPESNLNTFQNAPEPVDLFEGYYCRFLQFTELPNKEQQDAMRRTGLVIMDYVPKNAFMTAIPKGYDKSKLSALGVRAVIKQEPAQKISRTISGGFQDWAVNAPGTVDLDVQYYAHLNSTSVLNAAAKYGRVLGHLAENHVISIRIADKALWNLAEEPWVFFINSIAAPSVKDDTKGRSLHRSNSINTDFVTGRHYDGTGVTVAIADDGFVGPHIDFTGRMTNFATGTGQSHGDMTSGICVGAGNLNPVIRGMATGAYLYTYDIGAYPQVVNAVANYNNHGIVIASTSYSQGCNQYTSDTQFGDNLLYNNPQLQFVFSGGNSGSTNCNYGAGTAWGNITGGYKQGKNVVACGNLDELEVLDPSSSRGPASDGRIKPDICANGRNQLSTNENNTYQVGGGTSAASPGVAGVFAQLYQAYKQLTGASNPPAALIKASLLNTAEDIGNAGPDFIYGWGRVNALRALQTLEGNRYLTDSVTQGNNKTHIINVPAGTRQIRVMVYWSDIGGSPVAAPALVNNLNMTLTDPSAGVWNPWILDPTPIAANLNTPAIRGVDSLNNMEQVTLDNPAAGAYTVTVNGYALPSTGQRYYLVWEFRGDAVTMTYPNGAEGFVPGETEVLRWDGQRNLGTYTLEYTVNNGTSWLPIAASVAQNVQHYSWLVPNTVSGAVKVRVTRGAFSDMSDTSLAIIGVPSGLAVSWACPDSLRLTWAAVSGAASYTIYKLGNKYMDPIGTSTATNFIVTGTNPSLGYWFSVCANTPAGNKGRRAYAIYKAPGTSNCPLPFDVKLTSVASPASGNLSSCQNLSTIPVTVLLENTGQNALTNIPVNYRLNGGAVVSQTYAGPLNPGATYLYTFTANVNYSAGGSFSLQVYSTYPGDMNIYNDTLVVNSTVFSLYTIPVTENFQAVSFPPTAWSIQSAGGQYTWQQATGIPGATGTTTTCAFINNYSYNNPAAEDKLVTYTVSLAGATSARMTFDVAYARYSTAYSDSLRVDVSADCGNTWLPSGYFKGGLSLATVGTQTAYFTPASAAQWRKDTIDLTTWAGSNVIVRFVNINRYGNSLYLDNVNFTGATGNATLNLNVLFEGFHNGSGGMTPVLLNTGAGSNPSETDSVIVKLRNPSAPFAVVATATAVVNTSGLATFTFPPSVIGNNYFISVYHRNSVETWSALPQAFLATSTYNFTTSASQAFGANMRQLLPGVFAIYSGDLSPQDNVVDIIDQSAIDNDIFNFNGGYIVTDLSGDGAVDIVDQSILDNNIFGFISSSHP